MLFLLDDNQWLWWWWWHKKDFFFIFRFFLFSFLRTNTTCLCNRFKSGFHRIRFQFYCFRYLINRLLIDVFIIKTDAHAKHTTRYDLVYYTKPITSTSHQFEYKLKWIHRNLSSDFSFIWNQFEILNKTNSIHPCTL